MKSKTILDPFQRQPQPTVQPDQSDVAGPPTPAADPSGPAASTASQDGAQPTSGEQTAAQTDGKPAVPPQRDGNAATREAAAADQKATAQQRAQALARQRRQAMIVRDAVVPALMQVVVGADGTVDADTMRGYRDELMREMGNPTDPLERMMIEQIAVAHVVALHMHSLTALTKTAAEASLFAGAAAKLMAEQRRMILGYREYRSPVVRPQITKIGQQNVAERQEVRYAADARGDVLMECRDKNNPDSREASNGEEVGNDSCRQVAGAGGRWAKEPTVAGAAVS